MSSVNKRAQLSQIKTEYEAWLSNWMRIPKMFTDKRAYKLVQHLKFLIAELESAWSLADRLAAALKEISDVVPEYKENADLELIISLIESKTEEALAQYEQWRTNETIF